MRRTARGLVLAAGALLGAMAPARPARAWYFPEHTELTRLALQDFAPGFASAAIDRVVMDASDGSFCVAGYPALCRMAAVRLDSVAPLGPKACVPYSALAALAADHANTWRNLEQALLPTPVVEVSVPPFRGIGGGTTSRTTWPLALLLTDAARDTWQSFEANAPPELVREWTTGIDRLDASNVRLPLTLNPRDYVRQLDAALLILDPEYVTRAKGAKTHFHDETTTLSSILSRAARGDIDNALGQLLSHHVRSLQLAVAARSAGSAGLRLRQEALLEHAFALHFIEDGLAAGHIATDPAVTIDERRAQRHDYFNRQGLGVRRALANRPCDKLLSQGLSRSMGLDGCWVAHGDGFATAEDRRYVEEAAARVQTSFAIALEPPSDAWLDEQKASPACAAWNAGQGAPEDGCDLAWGAYLLDPWPEWTSDTRERAPGADWARKVIKDHSAAIAGLSALPPLVPADAGTPAAQPLVFPSELVNNVLPDKNTGELSAAAVLLRPILVAWPAAQADVTTLVGGDIFHRGLQMQFPLGTALGYTKPLRAGSSVAAWFGLGGGFGFVAQNVFPARVNRTLVEANVGFAQGVSLAGDKERFHTVGIAEVRAPLSSLAVYGLAYLFRSRKPLAILDDRVSWGLFGARAYALLTSPKVGFLGWDAEVINAYLGTPGSLEAAASGLTSTELRLRVGQRSSDFSAHGSVFSGSFFIAAELASGYYTTLR